MGRGKDLYSLLRVYYEKPIHTAINGSDLIHVQWGRRNLTH